MSYNIEMIYYDMLILNVKLKLDSGLKSVRYPDSDVCHHLPTRFTTLQDKDTESYFLVRYGVFR